MIATSNVKQPSFDDYTKATPLRIETPSDAPDLASYVGCIVNAATWLDIAARAHELGWDYDARAVKGGAHIRGLHCPASAADQAAYRAPWEEPVELDPAKDYGIDPATGRYVVLSA